MNCSKRGFEMITDRLFNEILNNDSIISGNDERAAKYSVDKTKNITASADLILIPENNEQISDIMKICYNNRIPIIPRGGGSGVTGGAAAVYGGIILSMEKFNNIIEVDTDNMIAVVEPGVITADINKTVKDKGLFYPPDPASMEECTIGGNLAESAGGPLAVKYGTTKDYILGIEFITPDGSVMSHGGKLVKNATGYNLTGLITGSEGTLAIVTKIFLKLIPLPRFSKDILISFETLEDAIDSVFEIIKMKCDPAAIEFMEKEAIQLVANNNENDILFSDAGAHLMVKFDGNNMEDIDTVIESLYSIKNISNENTFIASTPNESEKLWSARRGIRDAISAASPVFFAEDCVVPRSNIPQFIKDVKKYLNGKNISSLFFGHAGDGNVHLDILKGNISDEKWESIIPVLKKEIYSIAIKYEGAITGEHGIGSLRKAYLKDFMPESQINLYKNIKRAFDPHNILNPGKIIDL